MSIKAMKATPHKQLIDELMDCRIPKTEREHAAAREIERLRQAIEEAEKQEPVATWPSNTRYTVAVEGQELTYWDNIHDAITNAQRAVYSGPENTTRALDDLKGGRIAEWSYGFSAVRIYPPQNTALPKRTWVGLTEEEKHQLNDALNLQGRFPIIDAIQAKLREKNA